MTRSGTDAVAQAAERSSETSERNIAVLAGLPVAPDTANLRLGPELNHDLLALLPLVGVWRGIGEGNRAAITINPQDPKGTEGPETTDYRFGQEISISHDGGSYLVWNTKSWLIDENDTYLAPSYRESGFWRITAEDTIELMLTHADGTVELFYGNPLTQTSWELATDVVINSAAGLKRGGGKRLYGLVEDGDLAYVEERLDATGALVPHLSAKLQRFVG